LARAQAARALPFPFGRKRKQKGPFCTALRQRKNSATIQPVRRTFPNLTIHIVSNTWEDLFFTLRRKKSPHEPRRRVAAGAALAFRQRPAAHKDAGYESDHKPCFFVHSFLLLDLIDKLPPRRKASFRRGEFLLLQRGQPHKLPPGFRKITALSPLFHFILSTPPKTTANFQKTLVKDLTIISLFFEICN